MRHFKVNRMIKILNKDLKERISIILKLTLTISLFYIAFFSVTYLINDTHLPLSQFWRSYTLAIISITAIISPFLLYYNVNDSKKGVDYILLPASGFEKFLSMVILCFVIAPVIVLSSLSLLSLIFKIINPDIISASIFDYNIFGTLSYTSFGEFLTFPSLFLLGNLYFKKQKVVKTLLMIAGVIFSFIILFVIMFRFIFWNNINQIKDLDINVNLNDLDKLNYIDVFDDLSWLKITLYAFSVIYYIVIPVLSLSLSYRKIKNLQY